MIIDAYAHMENAKYFDRMVEKGGKWAKEITDQKLSVAPLKPHRYNVALRLEQLARNGIDYQVVTTQQTFDSNLCPGDMATKLAYAKELNDSQAALMEESKGKLLAIGTIPMAGMEQGGRQELDRAIKTIGLKGISVASNIHGKPVDAPEYEPFWAQAAELNIPVYIHPAHPESTVGRTYEADYDLVHHFGWPFETVLMLSRLVFSGIMERYPTLKVVSHHLGGGMIPFYMGRSLETYDADNPDNVDGKRAPVFSQGGGPLPGKLFDYFARFYYDTAVGGSAAAIRCTYEVFGADPLVFATDYPAGPAGAEGDYRLIEYPKVLRSLGLSEEDEKKIFAGNARKMLNMD